MDVMPIRPIQIRLPSLLYPIQASVFLAELPSVPEEATALRPQLPEEQVAVATSGNAPLLLLVPGPMWVPTPPVTILVRSPAPLFTAVSDLHL